jgi:hypothetical protein
MLQLWKATFRVFEIGRMNETTMKQKKDQMKKLGVMKEEE